MPRSAICLPEATSSGSPARSGACSVALLVERDGQDFVLKVANDPENKCSGKDEAGSAQRYGRGVKAHH
ncbi:MAG: hypothetical protein R3C02_07790 [Planctomycetaceae bacterium]